MAYRRSIIARSKLFYQQHQRFAPSLSHISGSDREQLPAERNPEILSNFLISRNNAGNSLLSGNVSRFMRSEVPAGYGLIFRRNMSKVPLDIEVPTEDLNGVIGVMADNAVKAAPVVNEVATAAAGSISNLNIIEFVHCYTGLEWWASIAAVTLLLRLAFTPFQVYNLLYFSQNQNLKNDIMLAIEKSLSGKDIKEPEPNKFLDSYGRFRFLGILCSHVPAIGIFTCVLNMVENIPSFTTGGTLWLTDLTTPNRVELPILLALTLWVRMELDPFLYIQGVEPRKNISERWPVYAASLSYLVVVAAGFPTAIYFSWITSNLFSIAYAIVMIHPQVQKLLGLSMTIPPLIRK